MTNQTTDKKISRYIVLLDKGDQSSLKKIESEFKVTITSSKELSQTTRSFNIQSKENSVFYKNLDIVVMDNVEPEHLNHALKDAKNPIIYFEPEREFYPVNELDILKELKVYSESLNKKLEELEDLLTSRLIPAPAVIEMEWGLKAIGADKTQLTGKGIDLCILDTGFDLSHPDFANRSIEGKSFVQNEEWDKDHNGHGTHCTGTAAGNKRLDTGKRYGVATESNIKIGKVLSDSGSGSSSNIIDAIDWAIEKKFRIISMSLGSPVSINEPPSPLFEMVGQKALENNCLVIAAAGNDSKRPSVPKPVSCPANSKSIMAVAAIDENLKVARFSNGGINAGIGGEINVCAPGVGILSSYSRNAKNPGLYIFLNGTSMATPHVSGMAALYMEAYPDKNAVEVWEMLEKKAKILENAKYRDTGKGLVQAIY